MNCEISLHGDTSISLYGTACTISGILAHDNGCGGIHVSGGDQVAMLLYIILYTCRYRYVGRFGNT